MSTLTPMSPAIDVAKSHRALAIAYGLLCHALFAAGVGTMIAAMFFGMSRSVGRVPPPWNILANALLLAQFPLLHSLLLSRHGAAILGRLSPKAIGPHMATTAYVIVASIQTFLLFALWSPGGTVWWRAEGAARWLVTGLYSVSWLLLLKAVWDAGLALQTGFLGWWAVANERVPVFPPLPTTGLFRVVRQPIYVAFSLTLWTVPTWTPDQLAVAVVLTAYCLGGPLLKERRFGRRFGEAFRTYAARVPYWSPWPRPAAVRNDLSVYDTPDWWSDGTRWLRVLRNLVPARFSFFDPIVGDWRGKDVLDLGCGGGFMAVALAGRGARVTGVDPSPPAIASATRHAVANGLPIDFRVGAGERLPCADGVFDVVVCVDVLEHIVDRKPVLVEIRRVLRPDGLLLFDTVNKTPLASFAMVTIGENMTGLLPRGTHDPAMFIHPGQLVRELDETGFDVGRLAGLGPRGLNRRFDLTFGLLPTMAIQYLGYARARP